MKDYERPTVGRLSGGVAECSSTRGATHKRTDSAGTSHGETLSESNHPSPGGRLIGGQTNQTYGYSLPLLVMETQPPLLSNYGQPEQHLGNSPFAGGCRFGAPTLSPLPARAFKHPLCITLLQIVRNPFFFFLLVFLVTRRDLARMARRVAFRRGASGD